MKIGRNEPCPCGSGQKSKRCHGTLRMPVDPRGREAWWVLFFKFRQVERMARSLLPTLYPEMNP